MGENANDSVVDSNLRSFDVPNLWIASTSTFPSGGGANPTLTLMLFTMRLADHLAKLHERSKRQEESIGDELVAVG
jgi:choline dehydrogenase-like flavoprotein